LGVVGENAPQRSLQTEIKLRELPAEIQALRDQLKEQDPALMAVVQPRVEAHIAACRIVAKRLQDWHRDISDKTDLDLAGYSRGAAVWLLAGRCLGLLEVLLVQAEAGVGNEALVVGRAIHEATNILLVFCGDPEEEELIRIWLEDEGKHGYVKQGAARAAHARFEEKLDEAMQRDGLKPLGRTKALTEELYDRMSRTAHNRRSSCLNSVWVEGREMSYGRTPTALRLAGSVSGVASITVGVVNAVGDALRTFYGQEFFVKEIAPLVEGIEAVRGSAPLDEAAIWEAAGRPY
jgi:hypothetical protein